MHPQAYCNWLSGLLDALPDGQSLTVDQTAKIKEKLHDVFEHVVETPTPKPPPGGTARAMC